MRQQEARAWLDCLETGGAAAALRQAPDDYAGMLLMAKCQIALDRNDEAALEEFNAYEELLPGNPYTIFLQGLSREGLGQRKKAAERFSNFLEQVDEEDVGDVGDVVEYSRQRLREWGFLEED